MCQISFLTDFRTEKNRLSKRELIVMIQRVWHILYASVCFERYQWINIETKRRKYFAKISCVYFKLITNILIDRVTREADKIKIKKQFHFISIIVVHIKLHKFAGILLLVIRIRAAEKLYIAWRGKQASGNFLGICFVFRQTAHDECEYTPFTHHAICFIFIVVCEDSQKL